MSTRPGPSGGYHTSDIPTGISSGGRQVKRLCFVAEPKDCFNLKGDWVVMAHNLDEAGDVEQVGGPHSPPRPQPRQKQSDVAHPVLTDASWR